MAQELAEELKVFVTAEVDKAIKGLKDVDKHTKAAESSFKILGKTITSTFLAKEIISFSKQSVDAWENQRQAVAVLNSTIAATGASAWTSSKQLQEMASSLQQITNYGDETIIQMQSVLLGFKNIKGDTFEGATKAILDMATVMKMDLSSAAQAVGKALDDPINGITSLQRQGFRFSEAQKAVIQSLIDTGDTAAAQKIILDELNSTYGGAAEAAVKATTQIKNAWGDLQEGVGSFLTGFVDNKFGQKIAEGILYIADAFATFHDNVDWLKGIESETAFNEYYTGLEDLDKQIEASSKWIDRYTNKINELNKELNAGGLSEFAENMDRALLEEAERNVALWKDELQMLLGIQSENQKIQQQENDRLEAETEISELMHSIGLDYEKLSKDDPLIQLQNYQKQLEKIANDKQKLSLTTTGLDTSEAIKQLDYNAEQIKAKMQAIRDKLQNDGKKSWQQYFEDVTGISQSSFTTGKQAGELYVKGLQEAFNQSEGLSELLGKKFNSKAAIENQMAELESTITNLLNIPADKINEAYSTADESIKVLIDEYKRLNEEKKEFEVTGALDELNEKIITLTKSERELFLIKLESNNATEEQIKKANELFDEYEKAQKEAKERNRSNDGIISWEEVLEKKLLSGIEKLNLFKKNADEANKTVAALGVQLVQLSFNSALSGAKELGKALGEGKSAGESMQQALANMGQEILNQLPMLFLQAGLQLIAQGQWALGLGLIGGGLASSVISGYNESQMQETNALGNVYGSNEISAFAKGGTFTNQIINKPTLFKFARGGKMGTGLMGEAGPEAIMPLKRGADGSLGVEASGSNVNLLLAVEINNYSSEQVKAQETTDENGQRKLMIMIGQAINSHISGGKADKAMSARYGLRAQGV